MNLQVDVERVCLAHRTVFSDLLAERAPDGRWPGQLSSSPLATAAAIGALVLSHRHGTAVQLRSQDSADGGQGLAQIVQYDLSELLLDSVQWLARQQNTDGGWGDCERGPSTLAATLVVLAAFRLTGVPARYADLMARAEEFVEQQGGVNRLRRKYERNRTFAAGILASMALADLIPWRQVPALAFESVCLPTRWRRHRRATIPPHELPAFLAIGRAKFFHDPPRNPLMRLVRRGLTGNCRSLLERLQADDGGFLDSPLQTGLIVMCLASCGEQDDPLVQRGIEFLLSTVRSNSSWSIERDHSVWATTLALNCLAIAPDPSPLQTTPYRPPVTDPPADRERQAAPVDGLPGGANARSYRRLDAAPHVSPPQSTSDTANPYEWDDEPLVDTSLLNWLLNCQQVWPGLQDKVPAGGWRRSDSSGSLPDTIVTANVLLALANCYGRTPPACRQSIDRSVGLAIRWLTAVQNPNGGWPTLYGARDTTKVGQSGVETTAIALRALATCPHYLQLVPAHHVSPHGTARVPDLAPAIARGLAYLGRQQRADGSFPSQWFGNQYHPHQENPVVATAQVLLTCADLGQLNTEMAARAAHWLSTAQHATGGWGPPRAPLDYSGTYKVGNRAWRSNDELAKYCSVEETALALDALFPFVDSSPSLGRAAAKGLDWLTQAIEQDAHRSGSVLGFNLAEVWYHDRLYPLAFASSALSKVVRQITAQSLLAVPVTSNADSQQRMG